MSNNQTYPIPPDGDVNRAPDMLAVINATTVVALLFLALDTVEK